jgi:hypothetical protein
MEKFNDLMMAVVIASTALLGLTGIIIGQILDRRKLDIKMTRKKNRNILVVSFALGILASLFGVIWFLVPVDLWRIIAVIAFMFQILCVFPTALAVWSVDKVK